jgi:choline dehydrogenase-like flavoprotein
VSATAIWDETDDTCHLNGTARRGDSPEHSVVNADCRSWDIPNLWICDGSVFPTVGGVNPSLTIQAIACRTADRIKVMAGRGELYSAPRQHARRALRNAPARPPAQSTASAPRTRIALQEYTLLTHCRNRPC